MNGNDGIIWQCPCMENDLQFFFNYLKINDKWPLFKEVINMHRYGVNISIHMCHYHMWVLGFISGCSLKWTSYIRNMILIGQDTVSYENYIYEFHCVVIMGWDL